MKKGFTLIELLAVIVILAIIAMIATPIVLGIIETTRKNAFRESSNKIMDAAKYVYAQTMYKNETPVDITFTYTNGEESSNVSGKVLNYSGTKPKSGVLLLTSTGDVAIALHDGKYCVYKSFNDDKVTIEEKSSANCTYEYSIDKGVNAPKLIAGMTPIKWNGTTWVNTTPSDDNWYDYGTTSTTRNWANAITKDGSMWVWIPRYIYKISTNWHSNTVGTIDIQFSRGTNDAWNDSIVLQTGTTASDSQNKWSNQPGFTFGTTELTGIWVAKFEATSVEEIKNGYTADSLCPTTGDNVSTKTVKIIPNVASWRCINNDNAFKAIRLMETNSTYGWGLASGLKVDGTFTTDTNNIDTHLIKNTEWGVVSYLAQSVYGRGNEEITINNSQNFITGCAGSTATAGAYNGCQNTYNTDNGKKASTTGTIYGVYDMVGGAWERVAAYMPNTSTSLNNGASIVSAVSKYKDVYTITTDTQVNNYSGFASKKGDALYETSNNATGNVGWFGDYISTPYVDNPWFFRSGDYSFGSGAGLYVFHHAPGSDFSSHGFRPVLTIANGL